MRRCPADCAATDPHRRRDYRALARFAVKVGALSYGGGFVIIPLIQSDAVGRYHWLTAAQFLNAVAL
jgi:chromate transport protein ChrA